MVVREEEIEVDVRIDGNVWRVVEMEINRSRYNNVDTALLKAVPDPDENPNHIPSYGDTVTINAGSTTRRAEESQAKQVMRVYTGEVSNRRDQSNGLWKIRCSNSMLEITNSEIFISTETWAYVSDLVELVANRVGVTANVDLEKPPEFYLGRSSDNGIPTYFQVWERLTETRDVRVSFDENRLQAADALDRLAEWSNAIWYIDRHDELHFGSADPRVHDLGEPYNHVVDTDAGKQTPPYKSVRVIGDGAVSEEGWQGKQLLAESPVVSVAELRHRSGMITPPNTSFDEIEIPEGGLTPPTFEYRNNEIKTKQQAKNVRSKILNELQEQQAGGWVKTVGRPNVGVLDIIEMPEEFGTTSQGETIPPAAYLVEQVSHRFNDSDGFVTRIECGGLAGRYEGDVVEEQDFSQNQVDDSDPMTKTNPVQ